MPNDTPSAASSNGLSDADAQTRLKTEGYNELPRPDRRTPLRIILEVLREPMLALLLGGGAIYLVLGDLKEAVILLAFATMPVMSGEIDLDLPSSVIVRRWFKRIESDASVSFRAPARSWWQCR